MSTLVQPQRHESFLVHRRFLYLWMALILSVSSVVAYVWLEPVRGNEGGTWLGYTLGTIATLLIAWLMLLGLRKRIYSKGAYSLKAWVSAHVYLGLATAVIATLHAAFQVGWNIHTLAYVLMMVVIISGIFGIVAYARIPRRMTYNRQSRSLAEMAKLCAEIDQECGAIALPLGDRFVEAVRMAQQETRLGGSTWRILRARDPRDGTEQALARLRKLATETHGPDARAVSSLMVALGRKQSLLQTMRRDLRLKALMDLWLLVHVPLSFALLAALTAHIVVVFFYWG
ncbi:MAG TPA: hypothetical protein VHL31_08905 [Geminicoccus sp.]|uniref:hypothetical protein n=1 Tax=Geminicoccus sp. TaxID=2024832 RepID=UPI002E34C541|nr:hypothetical protein [Geminicoccus sp.]HEX2526406.1 hypothetical protein [Geminicoccus sp.]